MDFPSGSAGKECTRNVGDPSSIPGSGRSPGEGIGCPAWCSGLENCIVHGVAKSGTRLSAFHSAPHPAVLFHPLWPFLAPTWVSHHSHMPHSVPSGAPPLLQPPRLLPSAPASPPRSPHPLALVGTPFPPLLELTAFLLHLPTWGPAPDSLPAQTPQSSLPSNSGYSLLSLSPWPILTICFRVFCCCYPQDSL